MNDKYWINESIHRAAGLVTAKHLQPLLLICSKQKSISTTRLEFELEKVHEKMKLDAIFLRDLSNRIKEDSKK